MPVSSCGDIKASTKHSRKPWAMGRMCQLVYLPLRMPDVSLANPTFHHYLIMNVARKLIEP